MSNYEVDTYTMTGVVLDNGSHRALIDCADRDGDPVITIEQNSSHEAITIELSVLLGACSTALDAQRDLLQEQPND